MNAQRDARQNVGTPTGPMLVKTGDFFGLLPRQFIKRKKEFFTYNIRFNTIAASTTSTLSANVQNDSDFVWVQGAVICTSAAFTVFTVSTLIPMLIEISDSASGVALQDSATHVSNLFGNAQLPFTLPFPKIFRKGGQITARLQNQDAGNAFVINLAFHGFKVYNIPADE